ncbi:MAG: hypothetical protein R3C05_18860 [Pirellulaceae bacterium]
MKARLQLLRELARFYQCCPDAELEEMSVEQLETLYSELRQRVGFRGKHIRLGVRHGTQTHRHMLHFQRIVSC